MSVVLTLRDSVAACRDAYETVIESVAGPLDERVFGDVQAAWRAYYQEVFGPFDRQLRAESALGQVDAYVPVSVSHHNLERLFEALAAELPADARLADAPIPERVLDLDVGIRRLRLLLTSRAAEPTPFGD
ncbi:MAG TPA: hypothetical protein VHR46_06955 [Gaiella sp.]|jgi:hypothetical protein|nr:hypothetical protein [Gaiella sp.]